MRSSRLRLNVKRQCVQIFLGCENEHLPPPPPVCSSRQELFSDPPAHVSRLGGEGGGRPLRRRGRCQETLGHQRKSSHPHTQRVTFQNWFPSNVSCPTVSTGQQDIVLLGDFNAGCSYVSGNEWQQIRLFTDKSFNWLIPDDADTTVSSTYCPYDR